MADIAGTFTASDGGYATGLVSRQAIASVSVEINQIEMGTGPLGPQPFAASDGGNLVAYGGNTALIHRYGLLFLNGGGNVTGTGAVFRAVTLKPVTLTLSQPELLLGPGPTPAPAGLTITLGDDSLDSAPGLIIAFISNGTPDGPASLAVTGSSETLYTAFDDTGAIGGISMPVHVNAAGAYHLVATDTTTNLTATAQFTVAAVATGSTIGAPVTTPPTNVQQSLGVRKWVFQDPASSDVYHFGINPNAMKSPFGPKRITFAATTAIDGRGLAFEGMAEPVQWEFSGALFDKAQYDALLYWYKKRNRIWVTDHRNRAWLVYLTGFSPVDRRATNHPWSHEYTMTALIFEGPVTPL